MNFIKKNFSSSIPLRVALYGIVLAILLTVAIFRVPEFLATLLSYYFSVVPINKAIFVSHPILCEDTQKRVQTLSLSEKKKLAEYMKSLIEAGPLALRAKFEENSSINLLTDLINIDLQSPIPKNIAAENCFFESLKSLGPAALPALPALIEENIIDKFTNLDRFDEIVKQITKNNPEAIEILNAAILKNNKDEGKSPKASSAWKHIGRVEPFPLKTVMEIIDISAPNSSNYEAAINAISGNLSNEHKLPQELVSFALDKTKSLERRLRMLEVIANANLINSIEPKAQIKLSNCEEQLIAHFFQQRIMLQFKIKTQEDLNSYFEINKKLFNNFVLKTQEDWARFNDIIKFLHNFSNSSSFRPQYKSANTAIPKPAQASLDYSAFVKPLSQILGIVSQQLGYQTKTYRDLVEAIIASPLAPSFAPYFEKLLSQKNERTIALTYLKRVNGVTPAIQLQIAKYLSGSTDEETLQILSLLQQHDWQTNDAKPVLFSTPLLDLLINLMASNNIAIIDSAHRTLMNQGESLVLYTREKIKTVSGAKKLALLRLDWQLSSTEQAYQALVSELKNTKVCNLLFSLAFTDLLNKIPDSKGLDKGKTANKETSLKIETSNLEGKKPSIPHTSSLNSSFVRNSPPADLFAKYLTCEVMFIQSQLIYYIVQKNNKFKELVKIEAEQSSKDKKKFLLEALNQPVYNHLQDGDCGPDC